MNVSLLYSKHRCVPTTHVAVFRVVQLWHSYHHLRTLTSVHCMYLLCTWPTDLLSMYQNVSPSDILHMSASYSFYTNYMIFFIKCVLIPTRKCGCILVFDTLNMATWAAETCRWLMRNKLTSINPYTILTFFLKKLHIIQHDFTYDKNHI